jgi:hypothetical protein
MKIKISLLVTLFAFSASLTAQTLDQRELEDGGSGPHSAIMLKDASLPAHTIFRPSILEEFKSRSGLPLLVWGNGACMDSPWEHVNYLNEIASYGYIVIAIGVMPKENGEQVQARSRSSKLRDAMDWAIAQNADKASQYYGRIDTKKIAVAGMSCGGLQALEVAGDPRIKTLIVANSGIFKDPIRGNAMPMMPQLTKDDLSKIHTPTLYLLGGPSDIAYENGMDDFNQINHVPVFVGNLDVGHGGTYRQPHGGDFAKVTLQWLNWQLKGERRAKQFFVGKKPGITNMEDWSYKHKNM